MMSTETNGTLLSKKRACANPEFLDQLSAQFDAARQVVEETLIIPYMEIYKQQKPMDAATVKATLQLQLGADVGKTIVFVRGEKNNTQSGTLITGTCAGCNNFKIVFRATRNAGFMVKPNESDLVHKIVENGVERNCPTTLHHASKATLIKNATFLAAAGNPKKRSIETIAQDLSQHKIFATTSIIKETLRLIGKPQPDDHVTALKNFPAELEAVQELNPSFYYEIETCAPFNLFKRLTVVMPHAKEATNYTFKVYGLDGAHMDPIEVRKKPRTLMKTNTLLAVTSRTPNNNITILAFMICYTENGVDVTHLLQTCIAQGLPLNLPDVTIISDRGLALAAGLREVTPLSYHAHCPKHLERNLTDNFKSDFSVELRSKYWKAQGATTRRLYLLAMEEMAALNGGRAVHDYLTGIENWALHTAILRGNMLHGMRSNNISEGVFAWTKKARKMSVVFCFRTIMKQMFAFNDKQRQLAMACKHLLTPAAQQLNNAELLAVSSITARRYAVTMLDHELQIAEIKCVGDQTYNTKTHITDLINVTCTCERIKQTGVVCRHWLVLAEFLKVVPEAKHYHASALTSTWKEMYDRCDTFTGLYPNGDEIASFGAEARADGRQQLIVKPWCEINEVKSTSTQRAPSRGDTVPGGTTRKKQSKKDKRPCFHCTKHISGLTKHPASACLMYRKFRQMMMAKESNLCFTFAAATLTGDDGSDDEGADAEGAAADI